MKTRFYCNTNEHSASAVAQTRRNGPSVLCKLLQALLLLLLLLLQQQQLQIHHSCFQTQKYITHKTSTSPQKPSHTEMSTRHSEIAEGRREGTNARARLKSRRRRPTKEQTEDPKVFRIYPPGTNPGWAGWCVVSTRLSLWLRGSQFFEKNTRVLRFTEPPLWLRFFGKGNQGNGLWCPFVSKKQFKEPPVPVLSQKAVNP